MENYIIMTDSTTDLPISYIKEKGLNVIPLGYTIDGKNYIDNHELSSSEFFQKIKQGYVAKTFQINPEQFYEEFKKVLSKGIGILGIFFSSGLSGTFNSARIARDQILEEMPNAKIEIVDSLCASLGEGLLVHYATLAKESGMSLEENKKYIEQLKLKVSHWFTVMDMDTLKRGGRISAGAAFFAKTLNINPILHVSNEGKLVAKTKKIGRKSALNALIDKVLENYIPEENKTIFISHSNSLDEANKIAEVIKAKTTVKDVLVNEIGPVIGGHCGVGTIAIFFVSAKR